MLRGFLRLLSRSSKRNAPSQNTTEHVTLYAQVEMPRARPPKAAELHPQRRSPSQQSIANASHRERLLSMQLAHTKLCSPKRCARLRELGITTAGDLACASPEKLAMHFGAPKKATRILKQYRRAIRFAASVPGMMPRDAMLLISIHRRSVRGLACEKAATLHRDLERFAESSKGMGQLRGRRIPSTRRLKRWIQECESRGSRAPLKVRAA